MKRQSVYYSIALFLLMVFVVYVVFIFAKNEDESVMVESRSNKLAELKEKMVNNLGTLQFEDYFEIQQVDYSMNEREVSHRLVMKNITGRDLRCNYQIYKEDELIDIYLD